MKKSARLYAFLFIYFCSTSYIFSDLTIQTSDDKKIEMPFWIADYSKILYDFVNDNAGYSEENALPLNSLAEKNLIPQDFVVDVNLTKEELQKVIDLFKIAEIPFLAHDLETLENRLIKDFAEKHLSSSDFFQFYKIAQVLDISILEKALSSFLLLCIKSSPSKINTNTELTKLLLKLNATYQTALQKNLNSLLAPTMQYQPDKHYVYSNFSHLGNKFALFSSDGWLDLFSIQNEKLHHEFSLDTGVFAHKNNELSSPFPNLSFFVGENSLLISQVGKKVKIAATVSVGKEPSSQEAMPQDIILLCPPLIVGLNSKNIEFLSNFHNAYNVFLANQMNIGPRDDIVIGNAVFSSIRYLILTSSRSYQLVGHADAALLIRYTPILQGGFVVSNSSELYHGEDKVRNVSFSSDGDYMMTCNRMSVKLWDKSKRLVKTLDLRNEGVVQSAQLSFLNRFLLVITMKDNQTVCHLFDTAQNFKKLLSRNTNGRVPAAFSADDTHLLLKINDALKCIDLTTMSEELLFKLPGNLEEVVTSKNNMLSIISTVNSNTTDLRIYNLNDIFKIKNFLKFLASDSQDKQTLENIPLSSATSLLGNAAGNVANVAHAQPTIVINPSRFERAKNLVTPSLMGAQGRLRAMKHFYLNTPQGREILKIAALGGITGALLLPIFIAYVVPYYRDTEGSKVIRATITGFLRTGNKIFLEKLKVLVQYIAKRTPQYTRAAPK